MNYEKKDHFKDALWNIEKGKKAIHSHNTSDARMYLIKAIRHITKVLLNL